MRIYLDVCCLCRPLDDQTDRRVYLETLAVKSIFSYVLEKKCLLVSSNVVDDEIGMTPDGERRRRIALFNSYAGVKVNVQPEDIPRIDFLHSIGFKLYDAMHIRCAEKGYAEVFLTTDDQMITVAHRESKHLDVRVLNPIDWIEEEPME